LRAGTADNLNVARTTLTALLVAQVRVLRSSRGLTIGYPDDADHSSLMLDSSLSPNEVDFTSLHVSTDATINGSKRALVEISWADGNTRSRATGWLRFTNKRYVGDDFSVLTEQAAVSVNPTSPADNWIDLAYRGLAPTTSNVTATVTGPIPVHHPQGDFTSLHHDSTLDAGERDVARVWLDPDLIEIGDHSITVTIDYSDNRGRTRSMEHDVLVSVIAGVPADIDIELN